MEIQIPHNFTPRQYQINLLKAVDNGKKRCVCVWHRRAGKDKTLINLVAKKMLERVGAYYYFFPTYEQGRKILWEGMDKDGFKFLDHIPEAIRKRTTSKPMFIELINGSTLSVIGTDEIDSIVGTNPIGTIWSEYSLQNPKAWGFIRPILEENGGWAVFNFTSRGKNHGYDLVEFARKNPDDWFLNILPATETGVFSPEQLEKIRKEYIEEDGDDLRFLQEYMCSFDGAIKGSYYGTQLAEAEKQKRIGKVPHDPAIKVDTWWDLGIGDAMAIWFTQSIGREVHVIDYLESEGEGMPYYIAALQQKGYVYGEHYFPHDGNARELSTGVTRIETAEKLGLRPINIVENIGVDDGIQAARLFINRCWFDEEKCAEGLDALKNYHKKFDDKREVYKDSPEHDWSSHGSDAFRYLAVGHGQYKDVIMQTKRQKTNIKLTKWG